MVVAADFHTFEDDAFEAAIEKRNKSSTLTNDYLKQC